MKVKISDLYDVGSSKRVFQSQWRDSGIPFYRAREIAKLSTDGFVDNELFIDEELYESYIAKYGKPQAGDIMITGVGTLGVCYIVRENDKFYFKDGNILWFRQKAPDRILPQYLVKAFDSKDVKEFISKNSSGTTVGTFTIQTANKMEIELPSIEEQRAIISKISLVEEVIRNRKTELQKLDDLIKARFVEMFGDPVTNPMDWPTKPLLDMGYCKNGMNFHTGDSGIEMHCLGVGDFKDYSVIDGTDYLPMISLNETPPEESMLQDGDIVFVRSNGNKALVGRCLLVYPHNTPTTYSGFCIRYRLTSAEVNTAYLLRVLKTDSMRKRMAGRGANIQNLNQQILAALNIPTPPLELQEQFAAFVEQVDKSKFAVQKALEKTQLLFDSLMQEYFG